MSIKFSPVAFESIRPRLADHLSALPSAVDSFVEFHLFDSNYFEIELNGEVAGLAAVYHNNLITHFSLADVRKKYGQAAFAQVKKLGEVQAALVPTCDEFFLSHALDEFRELRRQAYFFAAPAGAPLLSSPDIPVTLRTAGPADVALIKEKTGDFFGDMPRLVDKKELFLARKDSELVGFGVAESGRLVRGVASIGMFVLESQRQKGIGTAILQLLQHEARQRGLRPIAGCWVYNHLSKKTLEKAGMFTQTRLLRIGY